MDTKDHLAIWNPLLDVGIVDKGDLIVYTPLSSPELVRSRRGSADVAILQDDRERVLRQSRAIKLTLQIGWSKSSEQIQIAIDLVVFVGQRNVVFSGL